MSSSMGKMDGIGDVLVQCISLIIQLDCKTTHSTDGPFLITTIKHSKDSQLSTTPEDGTPLFMIRCSRTISNWFSKGTTWTSLVSLKARSSSMLTGTSVWWWEYAPLWASRMCGMLPFQATTTETVESASLNCLCFSRWFRGLTKEWWWMLVGEK